MARMSRLLTKLHNYKIPGTYLNNAATLVTSSQVCRRPGCVKLGLEATKTYDHFYSYQRNRLQILPALHILYSGIRAIGLCMQNIIFTTVVFNIDLPYVKRAISNLVWFWFNLTYLAKQATMFCEGVTCNMNNMILASAIEEGQSLWIYEIPMLPSRALQMRCIDSMEMPLAKNRNAHGRDGERDIYFKSYLTLSSGVHLQNTLNFNSNFLFSFWFCFL